MRLEKGKQMFIRGALTIICILFIGISICQLSVINRNYNKEKKTHQELLSYKPERNTLPEETPAEDLKVMNPEIIKLQEMNPDAIGWLTVPDTQMDYPFVKAEGYDQYLRTDFFGKESVAGTLFLDYRFAADLSGGQSIIFGHSMKNGSMFGGLKQYRNRSFYEKHQTAWVYLPYETIELSLVACVETKADDSVIYGVWDTEEKREAFWREVRNRSLHGSETVPEDLDKGSRFILLSTCSYESETSRLVVIFRVCEERQ